MRNDALPVLWSPAAAADLEAIFAYLLPLNPAVAEDVIQELTVAADSLAEFPFRGRQGRARGTRELLAVRPYAVVYEVRRDAVVILRLWHGMQARD